MDDIKLDIHFSGKAKCFDDSIHCKKNKRILKLYLYHCNHQINFTK